jgi:hypothetical protein
MRMSHSDLVGTSTGAVARCRSDRAPRRAVRRAVAAQRGSCSLLASGLEHEPVGAVAAPASCRQQQAAIAGGGAVRGRPPHFPRCNATRHRTEHVLASGRLATKGFPHAAQVRLNPRGAAASCALRLAISAS